MVVDAVADEEGTTLAEALQEVEADGVIGFDPELAGAVYTPGEPLAVTRSVTIDASAAPGFTLDGEGAPGGLRVGKDLHTKLVGLTIRESVTDEVGGGVYVNQIDGAVRDTVFVANDQGSIVGAGLERENNVFLPSEEEPDPMLGELEEKNGVWWYPPEPGSPVQALSMDGVGPDFPETRD